MEVNEKSESFSRLDLDIDEATTDGVDTSMLRQEEMTMAYFEVKVENGGLYDQIAIGVTTDSMYPCTEFAGYKSQSVAYHADDGKVYIKGRPLEGF